MIKKQIVKLKINNYILLNKIIVTVAEASITLNSTLKIKL